MRDDDGHTRTTRASDVVTFVRGGDGGALSRARSIDRAGRRGRAVGRRGTGAGASPPRSAARADVHATDERAGGDGKKKVRAIDAMLQEFAARAPEARLRTVSGAAGGGEHSRRRTRL